MVMLYAVIIYLQNTDTVSLEDFQRRIRIVNNLIRNTEYEISDSVVRQGGNRMPAILKQVDSIILSGTITTDIGINFNAAQIKEELEKIEWLKSNKDRSESLFKLEDHDLLYGQISIIGLEHPKYLE